MTLLRSSLALAIGSVPVLLALCLPALHGAPDSGHQGSESPAQAAETLDSIVQPRFQKNAGRFGVDRIIFPGHDNIYDLASSTAAERRKFREVNAGHRPYVIAFWHCVHKPGKDLITKGRFPQELASPSIQTLAAATATDAGTQKLMDWGDAALGKVVKPVWPTLRQGSGVNKEFGNWQVVMRPVRASRDSCLSCHAGAHRNDTLGVMVYAVDKETIHADIKSFNDGNP